MPHKDVFHDSVKVALEKDCWPKAHPKADIVLCFIAPANRQYTDFAVA